MNVNERTNKHDRSQYLLAEAISDCTLLMGNADAIRKTVNDVTKHLNTKFRY